jgi:hypothetical protein
MPAIASAPDEVFYHFAKQTQSTDALIRTLYTRPSKSTVDHFKATNNHLKDDKVQIGQLIIITPPNSMQCTAFEADLMDAALLVDQRLKELTAEDKRILAENYQLLNNITSVGGAGYGATLTYFSHHVKNIEGILKQIEQLYVKTYNSTSHLKSSRFHQQRKQLFMRLDMTMKTFVGEARAGFTYNYSGIKNGLGLSTKSIVHQWKSQPGNVTSIEGFSKNYDKAAKLSKTLKGAGYVGIALDVGQSGVKIHEACTIGTDKECTKTSFKEGGRLTGSVAGGAGGGIATAYITCNLLFGLETAGTSLLWCGIVAGVAGGYFGGKHLGNYGQNKGEALYETIYK